jgi:hypothetical protein
MAVPSCVHALVFIVVDMVGGTGIARVGRVRVRFAEREKQDVFPAAPKDGFTAIREAHSDPAYAGLMPFAIHTAAIFSSVREVLWTTSM